MQNSTSGVLFIPVHAPFSLDEKKRAVDTL